MLRQLPLEHAAGGDAVCSGLRYRVVPIDLNRHQLTQRTRARVFVLNGL